MGQATQHVPGRQILRQQMFFPGDPDQMIDTGNLKQAFLGVPDSQRRDDAIDGDLVCTRAPHADFMLGDRIPGDDGALDMCDKITAGILDKTGQWSAKCMSDSSTQKLFSCGIEIADAQVLIDQNDCQCQIFSDFPYIHGMYAT